MRREIEFRVWDTKLKKMMPWNPCIAFDDPEYEVMQWTGLTDITGKKIFDGDIVSYCKRGGFVEDGNLYTDEIMFGCTAFGQPLKFRKADHIMNPWNYLYQTYEVVGNIYETV